MEEIEFYSDGTVKVTNARFLVASDTYAMNGVTSVKKGRIEPDKKGPIICGIIGVLVFLLTAGFVGKTIGVLLVILAVWWAKQLATEFIVFLHSSSGETEALKSTNQTYIDDVIKALNESLIHRG